MTLPLKRYHRQIHSIAEPERPDEIEMSVNLASVEESIAVHTVGEQDLR